MCERGSQSQRKHLRNRVSSLDPAAGAQSNYRSDCASLLRPYLVDFAPTGPLPTTGASSGSSDVSDIELTRRSFTSLQPNVREFSTLRGGAGAIRTLSTAFFR